MDEVKVMVDPHDHCDCNTGKIYTKFAIVYSPIIPYPYV